MDDDRLFDPGPGEPQEPKGDLYKPPKAKQRPIHTDEEFRIQQLYKEHIKALIAANGLDPEAKHAQGAERGRLLLELVALADKERVLYYTGAKAGDHDEGADAAKDSVRTQLRAFWVGEAIRYEVMVLLEAVICDRKGMAYPGAFYNLQRRMPGIG